MESTRVSQLVLSFRRGIHGSIVLVGGLTASAYLLSIIRDALFATYYGGSAALDVYFVALSPSQFVGMESASLTYLAFLPEFSRAVGADPASYGNLVRERLKRLKEMLR